MSTVTRRKQIKQQSSTEMIEQLLTNLKSTNVEEREESCRTFTMILLEEPLTSSVPGMDRQQQQISASELIEKYGERIIPLLLENFATVSSALGTMSIDTRAKREEVKLALSLMTSASEALKNLCAKGGVLVCQRLTNNYNGVKIIFDLVNVLASFNTSATPQSDATEDDTDEIVEAVVGVLIQLILVLTELAENCEKSLELITKSGVAFKFLDLIFSAAEEQSNASDVNADPWKKLVNGSKDIKIVICKFLGTITDNNPTLSKLIVEHSPAGVFKTTVLGKLNTLFGRLGFDTNSIVSSLFTTDDKSAASSADDLEVLALMASFTYNILRNYYVPDTATSSSSSSPEAVELVEAFVPLFAKILSLSPANILKTVVEPGMLALDSMSSAASSSSSNGGSEKDIGSASGMTSNDGEDEMGAGGEAEVETDEHFSEKLEILLKWKEIGAAQQVLLETLTNICFCEGEAEDDIDMNDDDMDDSDDAIGQTSVTSDTSAAPTILAIEKSGILDLVTQRASDVTDFANDFIERHAWTEGHVTILFTVQSRALACLNNVIISNGTIANTQALWQFAEAITLSAVRSCEGARSSGSISTSTGSAGSSTSSVGDESDLSRIEIELLEEATSILDSAARRFFRPEDLPGLTWRPALDTLLRVAQAGVSDSAALHAVGAIGFVGALYTGSVLETETIINALLVIIMDEASNIELVCAAINAIIDLFAEKPSNPAMYVSHAKIVTAFTQILPSFKRRTALEKKKGDKSLFLRLDETRINMARLIKYKSAQNLTSF